MTSGYSWARPFMSRALATPQALKAAPCVCVWGGDVGGAGGGAAARSVSLRLVLQGCVCARVCDELTET